MAIVGSSLVTAGKTATVEIFNIALPGTPNTEVSQNLSTGLISGYMIKTRGNSELKLTHTASESGTKYLTIEKHSVFADEKPYNNLTLYFQSPQTGDTVEIWVWKN